MEEVFNSLISILKRDSEIFRKVFDLIPVGISITTDITCRNIVHNNKAAEFLRIQPVEALSQTKTASGNLPLKMFYEGRELSLEEMPIQRSVWQGETVKEQKIDLFWEDGKHKTAIWSSIPLLDENGSIVGAVAAFEDITERKELEYLLKEHQEHLEELVKKRTWEVEVSNYQLKKENLRRIEVEEELRKKNEEISIILESVTDSFFALDNEWKFIYANEEAKKYFPNKDILGKNILGENLLSLIPDARGSIFWENYHKVMLYREPIHFEAKTIYTKTWVAVHVYPFQNGISVIFQDISKKKRIEDNLRLSEEKFSDAFYKSPAMMVISSLDGKIIEANERFLETLEYNLEEVLGNAPTGSRSWSIPADREIIVDRLSETGSVKNFETTFISRTGKTVDVLSSIDLIEITGEKCLISTMIDITEKKKMEKTLEAEKDRWLITFMSCGDGIITTDVEGRVEKMNRVAETLTGWSQEEAKGRPLAEVFHIINEQTRQRCENPVEKVLATGKIIGLANHTALIARDGTERVLADSAAPIYDSEGNMHGVV
ncbi:MAG TPA: hypothetical protein DCW46_00430, partial [Desulfotomaculum sp.]|nr:hypothetical protein [Desulfotomaculum sp.]